MTIEEIEEEIKLAKKEGRDLECIDCGWGLNKKEYREGNGLCESCIWLLTK